MHWNMERSQYDRADLDGFFVIQGLGDADLQFGDLVEVVLFGGEAERHGGPPNILRIGLQPSAIKRK